MSLETANKVYLKLPGTSANLGPGFDALALALTLYLEVEAVPAAEFSIQASGRNAEVCSGMERNLLLHSYRNVLEQFGAPVLPLSLTVRNGIPIGMGCGSSAATRLAGVALAAHFGELRWDRDRILTEASRLEGHPDNTTACWLGGLTVACWSGSGAEQQVKAVSLSPDVPWRALVVMPATPLATTLSRKVVPASFSREDAVFNLQRAALLTAAFATGRGELLATAVEDRMHQPYRAEVCPLLKKLLPLSGNDGILSVTLSGAGPSVLLLIESAEHTQAAKELVMRHAGDDVLEILECGIEPSEAEYTCQSDTSF